MSKITNQLRLRYNSQLLLPDTGYFLFVSFEVFLQWLKPEAYLEPSRLRLLLIYITPLTIFLKRFHRRCSSRSKNASENLSSSVSL